jgi:hypothetical protein
MGMATLQMGYLAMKIRAAKRFISLWAIVDLGMVVMGYAVGAMAFAQSDSLNLALGILGVFASFKMVWFLKGLESMNQVVLAF